jgi:hypothetical protein
MNQGQPDNEELKKESQAESAVGDGEAIIPKRRAKRTLADESDSEKMEEALQVELDEKSAQKKAALEKQQAELKAKIAG